MASTARSGTLICSADLVTLARERTALKNGGVPSRSRGCPMGSNSTGLESENAVVMPGTAFSTPGPNCIANAPGGRPLLTRAKPSAMPTPIRSCRHTIGRMSSAAAASISGVVGKQLSESIPSRRRIRAMASMTFMPGSPPS